MASNAKRNVGLMVRLAIVLVVAGVAICLAGRGVVAQDSATPANATTQPTATDNQNVFAYELYSHLAAKEGNVFCSPFSVEQALYMTWFATAGDTAKQIAATLCLPNTNDEDVAKTIAELRKQVEVGASPDNLSVKYELSVANGLWYQTKMQPKGDFLTRIGKDFSGQIKELDFAAKSDACRKEINEWVAQKTKDKIKDILPDGSITPATSVVLANAVYFYASWLQDFKKDDTQNKPFYVMADKTIDVAMMHQKNLHRYAETEQIQLLELLYDDMASSMLIVLPREKDGLSKVEKTLNKTLPAAIKSLDYSAVDIQLPKFRFESEFKLKDTLQAMGIRDVFDAKRADFTNMVDLNGLYISDVFHKSFVGVDEKGTEAAAATAVAIFGAASPSSKFKEFIADHPFVFIIRDKFGTILFMGRVADPRGAGGATSAPAAASKPASPTDVE